MKIIKVFLFLFVAASVNCFGQGISNNWLMGYDNGGGETKFDFFSSAQI